MLCTQKGVDEIQQRFSLKQLMLLDTKFNFLEFMAERKFFVIFNIVLW